MIPVASPLFHLGDDLFIVTRRNVKTPGAMQARVVGNSLQKIAAETTGRFDQKSHFSDSGHRHNWRTGIVKEALGKERSPQRCNRTEFLITPRELWIGGKSDAIIGAQEYRNFFRNCACGSAAIRIRLRETRLANIAVENPIVG